MADDTFQRDLTRFAAALAARPLNYDQLISVIRDIEVPSAPDSHDLSRLFACCYQLLGADGTGRNARMLAEMSDRQAGHMHACGLEMIEHVLYDPNAQSRTWISERIAWHKTNGLEVPEDYLETDLPPALTIPWDRVTAQKNLAPLLNFWQQKLAGNPTAHFSLCWKVMRDGYGVFKVVIGNWMQILETRNLGLAGTVAAFATANDLLQQADAPNLTSWSVCERDLLPLLKDAHPMVVAGAARYLGALYDEPEFASQDDVPGLVAMLEKLSSLEKFKAIACGAFICGFDSDCAGLYSLANHSEVAAADFDMDAWILEIVGADDYEPYLPNAQALWFYIHEYYDSSPEMVAKFIDADRSWLAMMCATEVHERVEGMQPILERLVNTPDPEIADAARQHLAEHYQSGSA